MSAKADAGAFEARAWTGPLRLSRYAVPSWSKERAWTAAAACAQPDVDADIFFPAGMHMTRARSERAKAVCARCPVLGRCRELVDLLETGSAQTGVWAGETEGERRRRRFFAQAGTNGGVGEAH